MAVPDVTGLPDLHVDFTVNPNHVDADGKAEFWPYLRDPETLARPWTVPGTPGLAHRIGGLEKADGIGTVSYDGHNHERMVELRAAKVAGIEVPPLEVDADPEAEVLVIGWGSTHGPIRTGWCATLRRRIARGASAPALPQPDARQHRQGAAQAPARPGAGDEQRATRDAAARQLPGERGEHHQDSGAAVQGRRTRRADLGGDRITPEVATLKAKDSKSDQEVRWCPGCGDYAIPATVQGFPPELGRSPEDIVFISGIGCSSRFPYYLSTYGVHSIHGRAPTLATGVVGLAARPRRRGW